MVPVDVLPPGELDPTLPPGFEVAFGVFPVIFVLAVVVMIALAIRRGARYLQHGIDPTVADVDLTARALKSEALAPERSVEDRLAELDRLHSAGTISDEERAAARARVLGDV